MRQERTKRVKKIEQDPRQKRRQDKRRQNKTIQDKRRQSKRKKDR